METPLVWPGFDPVALDLGFFQIRWYALAYVTGFLFMWAYGAWLSRRRGDPRLGLAMGDLIVYVVAGVILGGRLGFVLFYQPEMLLDDPLALLRLWEGGMSFHGGLLGVLIAIVVFSRVHRFHPLAVGDLLASGVPVGLGLGRLANFINGELWGRPSDLPWAMVFPDPRANPPPPADPIPRHPSQLYEFALEGVILLAILTWLAWRTGALRRPGTLAGWFLILYAVFRFAVEFVREWRPWGDPEPLIFGVLTTGQILCVPMVIGGLLVLALRPPPRSADTIAALDPAPGRPLDPPSGRPPG